MHHEGDAGDRSARPHRRTRVRGAAAGKLPLVMVGVLVAVALGVLVHPTELAGALSRVSPWRLGLVGLLALAYIAFQAVRWHGLLGAVGVRLRLRDSVLLTFGGRSSALLPVGELTRAVLVVRATGAEPGAVVATVTVQELIYTAVLIVTALPGALALHSGGVALAVVAVGIAAVLVLLCVPRLFEPVRRGVEQVPGARRLGPHLSTLQASTASLLRRRQTAVGTVYSALGAVTAVTIFWLLSDAVAPGHLSWTQAAFVYAVSHMAGALSMVPGGIGACDASIVALLSTVGIAPAAAAAIALLEHAADKLIGSGVGLVVFAAVRQRFRLPWHSLLQPLPTPVAVAA